MRPPPHYSCFIRAAPRAQHLVDVHARAEANEIIAALQIRLPAAKPCIVLKEGIACQRSGKLTVMTVISFRVLEHRLARWLANSCATAAHHPTDTHRATCADEATTQAAGRGRATSSVACGHDAT